MPNKLWSNLKDAVNKSAAGDWAKDLSIPDLTSNEWARIGDLGPTYSNSEIRRIILDERAAKKR
ncbi:MAG: hypothetical protein RLZZ298_1001 [Pseudomonadota bacterium]